MSKVVVIKCNNKRRYVNPVSMMIKMCRYPSKPAPRDIYTLPEPSEQDPPDKVKAVYSNDLNVLKIHEAIATRLSYMKNKVPDMRKTIEKMKLDLDDDSLTLVERNVLIDEITSREEETDLHEDGTCWRQYVSRARPILERYIPLRSERIKGVVRIGGKIKENPSKTKARLITIAEYLDLASEYLQLDITRNDNDIVKCPNCKTPVKHNHEETDVCDCGYDRSHLSKGSSHKDTVRLNYGNKNSYKDRDTFQRGILKWQGKHNTPIPDEIYTKLDEYYISKGFYTGEQIRNNPDLIKKTSVILLVEGLSETDNSEYYSMVNPIGANYWGWKLTDLSSYMSRIMREYDATQKVYMRIKTRESSLNVNIRIFFHLRAIGIKCKWTDFKILSSRDSLEYHQRMWDQMCLETGVKRTDII